MRIVTNILKQHTPQSLVTTDGRFLKLYMLHSYEIETRIVEMNRRQELTQVKS